jgi:hypothetical protein
LGDYLDLDLVEMLLFRKSCQRVETELQCWIADQQSSLSAVVDVITPTQSSIFDLADFAALVTRQAQVEAVGDLFSKKQHQQLGTYIGDIVLLEI